MKQMALNTIVVAKCAVCAQFVRSLLVKKTRHRLTRRVAKCPKLRANCANCKQSAPTTSHLGHRKVTQFCRCHNTSPIRSVILPPSSPSLISKTSYIFKSFTKGIIFLILI